MSTGERGATPIVVHRHESRALFNQDCKLAVLIAIARLPTGKFDLTDLLPGPEYASRFHKALQDLTEAQMLRKLPKEGRSQPYERVDSRIWGWAREYDDFLSSTFASTQPRAGSTQL